MRGHAGSEPPPIVTGARRAVTRLLAGVALLVATATAVYAQDASRSPLPPTQGVLDVVRGWLGSDSRDAALLPPDEAFRLSVRAKDAQTLVATLTPAPRYYLYRDRISFRLDDPPGMAIDSIALPAGEMKEDATFGTTEVYHQPVDAVIRITGASPATAAIRLHASYQGCNEPRGVCYPPIEKTFTVALDATGTGAARGLGPLPQAEVLAARSEPAGIDDSDTGRVRQLFSHGGSWGLIATFFGFGVLLAFTPCMLPMIPILSGIIVGQGADTTKRRAVGLSAIYVLGMALTYAAAGVAAGLAGSMLSTALQSPWVLGAFAAIFVALALSMFGLYELQLPASVQSALAGTTNRIPGGRATGVFVIGALSALIIGPCVAAPLAGALLYIGQTGDAALGGAALFSMAIGMGVPLLVVGATAGAFFRRAGPWTTWVKKAFGVAMLATAIYLVSPVIPLVAQQLLWAALLIGTAMFLRAIDSLPPDAPAHSRLLKAVGIMGLVGGIALLIGALAGTKDLLQPLAGLGGRHAEVRQELAFVPVKSIAEVDAQLQAAQGKPVMLDFWAEWCVSCNEMDRFTFSDPEVQSRLKGVLLLKADVTANNADDKALLRRFQLFGPPGIVFFDTQGSEHAYRVIGYEAPQKFLASLDTVLAQDRP